MTNRLASRPSPKSLRIFAGASDRAPFKDLPEPFND